MRGRCGADDSRRRQGYEALVQSLGHHEIGHVIERERSFEPVFGELARAEHCARIVDQDIDTGLRFGDFGGDPLHFRDAREIGIMNRVGKAGRAVVPLHHHANEQITWITQGEAEVYSQGKKYVIHAGDIMILPTFRTSSGSPRIRSISISSHRSGKTGWTGRQTTSRRNRLLSVAQPSLTVEI